MIDIEYFLNDLTLKKIDSKNWSSDQQDIVVYDRWRGVNSWLQRHFL